MQIMEVMEGKQFDLSVTDGSMRLARTGNPDDPDRDEAIGIAPKQGCE